MGLDYNYAGLLLTETVTNGILDGWSVANGYDSMLRRTRVSLEKDTTEYQKASFGYDAGGRLGSVTDGLSTALKATYSTNAQYPDITVLSLYGSQQSSTGKVFVAKHPESFSYDEDGNLTSDGRWTYTWDGENRLIEMKRDTDTPAGARQRLVFEYDYQGRRIHKQTYTYGSGWQEEQDIAFAYDGWNLLGELNVNDSDARLRTYLWGLDLSGSEQGAGGVGGLLKITDYTSGTTHHFVAYDGNGNVAGLVNSTNASVSARYEYGPFGEAIRATGPMAANNPIRFSSKYTDQESGLLYYGYRFYNPSTGRWLSRDPIEEKGGRNLYVLLMNSAINDVEFLGLYRMRGKQIEVKRCEVVYLFGHQDKRDPWQFKLEDDAVGAAFNGCWPTRTNKRIRKGYLIPGAPLHDKGEWTLPSNYVPGAGPFEEINGPIYNQLQDDPDTDWKRWDEQIRKGIRMLVKLACASGCCDEITVHEINTPKKLENTPDNDKWIVTCPAKM